VQAIWKSLAGRASVVVRGSEAIVAMPVFELLGNCINEMATEAAADGMLFGLRGFPEFRGHTGNQWESWITKEIGRRCDFGREPVYPTEAVSMFSLKRLGIRGRKRQRGDLLDQRQPSRKLFIECKAIFECNLQKVKGGFEYKGKHYLRDYRANYPAADPRTTMICVSIEEAWIDAAKLSCLRECSADIQLGLLLLEFDREGREISSRNDYKNLERRLHHDGWSKAGRKTWTDKVAIRAKNGFREHMVLWRK
jgi:hypothetical protein